MKKKIIAILLTMTMIIGYSMTVGAATNKTINDSEGGTDSNEVTANFDMDDPDSIYSVNIVWDNLDFTYDGKIEWNSTGNCYRAKDETTTWKPTSSVLTVINNSSAQVKAKVAFSKSANIEGITGTISGELSDTDTVIETKANGESMDIDKVVNLGISGAPSKILDYKQIGYVIGNVTVTISPVS